MGKRNHLMIGGPLSGRSVLIEGPILRVPVPRPVATWGTHLPFDLPTNYDLVIYHSHSLGIGRWVYAVATPTPLGQDWEEDEWLDALIEHKDTASFRYARRA